MSKPALCFKCKSSANIKINVLKYCNSCFIDLFEQKIQKNIPKISSDQSVLALLPSTSSSKVILNFLEKFFANRPIKSFKIHSKNRSLIEASPLEKLEDTTEILKINREDKSTTDIEDLFSSHSKAIGFCENNNFSTLFILESLNSTITKSLFDICRGDSESAIRNVALSTDKVRVYNILENIKIKELVYYMYLKKIPIMSAPSDNKSIPDRIKETIKQFLLEIDDKNELAIFNTSNTLKKLNEHS